MGISYFVFFQWEIYFNPIIIQPNFYELFISRGKHTIAQLADIARREGEEHISIIEEQGKRPAVLVMITVSETGEWKWAGERPIDKDKNAG